MEKIDYYCHNYILNILGFEDQFNYPSTVTLKQNDISNCIVINIIMMDISDNKQLKISIANNVVDWI
jgi:hypothetical protein